MRMAVIGLDCVPLEFALERFDTPNLRGLAQRGAFGYLESVVPPITVPAWASMVTGKDPGTLGIYGFRNRRDYTYDSLALATSHSIHEPAVWDRLGERGVRSIVVGVPPAYPPKPINGYQISCLLTPSAASGYTWPPDLKTDIENHFGEYLFDIANFRTEDKVGLLRRLYALTEQRFAVIRYLMTTRIWEYLMFVEMGPDRLHHGFWKYWDPEHIHHPSGNPFRTVFEEYYAFLDRQVGTLLDIMPPDTAVLVVSDHGAKRMDGAICVNEWLRRHGYLVLKEKLWTAQALTPAMVDWDRTLAWGEGGYYSRIFLNLRRREPRGVVEPDDYDRIRDEIAQGLQALGDELGTPIGTRVHRPEGLYRHQNGIPPDLIALFGDLHWRSAATVGGGIWLRENDTGPDDANHAQYGMFISTGLDLPAGRRSGTHLLDIARLIGRYFGLDTDGAE